MTRDMDASHFMNSRSNPTLTIDLQNRTANNLNQIDTVEAASDACVWRS